MSTTQPLRRIWLCADDYGIAPGVNTAIRDLIAHGRVNATSVMVVAPSFNAAEAEALARLNSAAPRVAIGLHLTLTAPFKPLTTNFRPLRQGHFLPLGSALRAGLLRQYRGHLLRAETAAQLTAFVSTFGHPPAFIDGHQHVQLFPQVREAVLSVVKAAAPQAWVRQCGRIPEARRHGDRKAVLLDWLSRRFRAHAARLGLPTNPAFAGAYDFSLKRDFAQIFPCFLQSLPEYGLVMCHPGFPDEELARLDPVTSQRRREYDFFASDAFPSLLQAHGVTLA